MIQIYLNTYFMCYIYDHLRKRSQNDEKCESIYQFQRLGLLDSMVSDPEFTRQVATI